MSDADPAPPRIEIRPAGGLVTVRAAGQVVACSADALRLAEGEYPPVYYLPAAHTLFAAHWPKPGETTCPWKGKARYFEVASGPAEAWSYPAPLPGVAGIAGHYAWQGDGVAVTRDEPGGVPDDAAAVLRFWFEETPSKHHFVRNDEFDAAIRARFGALHDRAARGDCADWTTTPDGALALLIVLDQFSRNLYRDDPRAFAQDEAAFRVAEGMIAQGHDLALDPDRRAFAYMPHMHREDLAAQNACVALFRDRLPGADNLRFAIGHREEIHRHGRFRGRDEALRRG